MPSFFKKLESWIAAGHNQFMSARPCICFVFVFITFAAEGFSQTTTNEIYVPSSLVYCNADQKAYWAECFGHYYHPDGRQYIGEWIANKMSGPGILIRPNGERYVGNFSAGDIDGPGIEYSARGDVKRSGEWTKGLLTAPRSLDPAWYPFNLRGSLREFQKNKAVSLTPSPDVAAQLKAALEDLQAVKNQNLELLRQINELKKARQTKSTDVVEACLARGLRPGTASFSECIGNGS